MWSVMFICRRSVIMLRISFVCWFFFFFFSSRRRHTRLQGDWSSDVCSSDLSPPGRDLGEERLQIARCGGVHRDVLPLMRALYQPPPSDGNRGRFLNDIVEIGRASCRERV